MAKPEKDNPGHVTRIEFNSRFKKVDLALFGSDGRGGIVKDIGDIKGILKVIEETRREKTKEEKAQERDYRGLLYSIVGGVIVGLLSWALTGF